MSKSNDAFFCVLFVSCIFALFSIWVGFFGGIIVSHIDGTDLAWILTQNSIYYGANAIFALFVGILAGFNVKKRFYGPFLTAVFLLPTMLLFRYYTHFIDWFCIATTLIVGLTAMLVSAVVTKKKDAKLRENHVTV